ncbi:hypothetical protein J4E91_001813 [Alternaria rosae]|nr:hypothetical protein J4E91_001813 [Alternaria rosae]
MSDTNATDSGVVHQSLYEQLRRLRRQTHRNRNRNRNRNLALDLNSLIQLPQNRTSDLIIDIDIDQLRQDLTGLERSVPNITSDQRRFLRRMDLNMARNLRTRGRATEATGESTAAPAPAAAPQAQAALKLATTLVSMLPKTPYNEMKEAEGIVKTPMYTKMQLALLEWLGKYPSAKLTVRQAHRWTESIAENKRPNAKLALRLCYYMRSQGFDTYADIRDSSISLYLSNQAPERGQHKALLYWKQNYTTNAIEHTISEEHIPARPARYDDFIPSVVSEHQLLDALLVGPDPRIPQHAGGPAPQVPEGDEAQEEDVRPTEHNVTTLLAVAQADLEAQFLSDTSDTDRVEALLTQIEQLHSQE